MITFTHLDDAGHARMVDVTQKQPTVRRAVAEGFVECAPRVVAALRAGSVPKGDVIGVHGVTVDLEIADAGVAIRATVSTADRTGVEMEALTAVSVAALNVIDMVKGLDKATSLRDVRLVAKDGGNSG